MVANTRPNLECRYPDTGVPANGSLTLEAGVVIVSFEDGTSADARTRLFTDPS